MNALAFGMLLGVAAMVLVFAAPFSWRHRWVAVAISPLLVFHGYVMWRCHLDMQAGGWTLISSPWPHIGIAGVVVTNALGILAIVFDKQLMWLVDQASSRNPAARVK